MIWYSSLCRLAAFIHPYSCQCAQAPFLEPKRYCSNITLQHITQSNYTEMWQLYCCCRGAYCYTLNEMCRYKNYMLRSYFHICHCENGALRSDRIKFCGWSTFITSFMQWSRIAIKHKRWPTLFQSMCQYAEMIRIHHRSRKQSLSVPLTLWTKWKIWCTKGTLIKQCEVSLGWCSILQKGNFHLFGPKELQRPNFPLITLPNIGAYTCVMSQILRFGHFLAD